VAQIDDSGEVQNLRSGERTNVSPHCMGGVLADFHTHPPLSVLALPKRRYLFCTTK